MSYNVYRGECPTCTTLLASVPPLPGDRFAVYVDATTEPDRTYFYQVAQVRFDGEAPHSNQMRVTPATEPGVAPPVLAALADPESISLAWAFNPAAHEEFVTGFNIYRGTCSGCATFLDWVPVTTGGLAETYTDSAIDPQETYFYRVAPTFTSMEGIPSNEVIGATRGAPQTAMIHWQNGFGWSYQATPGLSCLSNEQPVVDGVGWAELDCVIIERLPAGYHCVNAAVSATIVATGFGGVTGYVQCGGLVASCWHHTSAGTDCPGAAWGSSDGDLWCSSRVSHFGNDELHRFETACSNDP